MLDLTACHAQPPQPEVPMTVLDSTLCDMPAWQSLDTYHNEMQLAKTSRQEQHLADFRAGPVVRQLLGSGGEGRHGQHSQVQLLGQVPSERMLEGCPVLLGMAGSHAGGPASQQRLQRTCIFWVCLCSLVGSRRVSLGIGGSSHHSASCKASRQHGSGNASCCWMLSAVFADEATLMLLSNLGRWETMTWLHRRLQHMPAVQPFAARYRLHLIPAPYSSAC